MAPEKLAAAFGRAFLDKISPPLAKRKTSLREICVWRAQRKAITFRANIAVKLVKYGAVQRALGVIKPRLEVSVAAKRINSSQLCRVSHKFAQIKRNIYLLLKRSGIIPIYPSGDVNPVGELPRPAPERLSVFNDLKMRDGDNTVKLKIFTMGEFRSLTSRQPKGNYPRKTAAV